MESERLIGCSYRDIPVTMLYGLASTPRVKGERWCYYTSYSESTPAECLAVSIGDLVELVCYEEASAVGVWLGVYIIDSKVFSGSAAREHLDVHRAFILLLGPGGLHHVYTGELHDLRVLSRVGG